MWNPSEDPFLPKAARYNLSTVAAGKAAAKSLLQTRLGLTLAPDVPLFVYIGRLEEQKGADIMIAALPLLFGPPVNYQATTSSANTATNLPGPLLSPSSSPLPPPLILPALLSDVMQQHTTLHQLSQPSSEAPYSQTVSMLDWPSRASAAHPPPITMQQSQPQSVVQQASIVASSQNEMLLTAIVNAATGGAIPLASIYAVSPSTPTAAGAAAVSVAPAVGITAAQPQLQLVMLGQGQPWMERNLSRLSSIYPGLAHGVPAFVEPLAHMMMAAADFVIIPSRQEPCGLVALIAARYGAVPVVSMVGGLADLMSSPLLSTDVASPELKSVAAKSVQASMSLERKGGPDVADSLDSTHVSQLEIKASSRICGTEQSSTDVFCQNLRTLPGHINQVSAADTASSCSVLPVTKDTRCAESQQLCSEDPEDRDQLPAESWSSQLNQTTADVDPRVGLCPNDSGARPHVLGYSLVKPLGPAGDPSYLRDDANCLAEAVKFASLRYGTTEFLSMRDACMMHDVSWDQPVTEWEKMITQLSCTDAQ